MHKMMKLYFNLKGAMPFEMNIINNASKYFICGKFVPEMAFAYIHY